MRGRIWVVYMAVACASATSTPAHSAPIDRVLPEHYEPLVAPVKVDVGDIVDRWSGEVLSAVATCIDGKVETRDGPTTRAHSTSAGGLRLDATAVVAPVSGSGRIDWSAGAVLSNASAKELAPGPKPSRECLRRLEEEVDERRRSSDHVDPRWVRGVVVGDLEVSRDRSGSVEIEGEAVAPGVTVGGGAHGGTSSGFAALDAVVGYRLVHVPGFSMPPQGPVLEAMVGLPVEVRAGWAARGGLRRVGIGTGFGAGWASTTKSGASSGTFSSGFGYGNAHVALGPVQRGGLQRLEVEVHAGIYAATSTVLFDQHPDLGAGGSLRWGPRGRALWGSLGMTYINTFESDGEYATWDSFMPVATLGGTLALGR